MDDARKKGFSSHDFHHFARQTMVGMSQLYMNVIIMPVLDKLWDRGGWGRGEDTQVLICFQDNLARLII